MELDRVRQNEQTVQVSRSQLKGVMKSKLDIYNILSKEGQLYLPPINDCPMTFIKEILTGKKEVSAATLDATAHRSSRTPTSR